MSRRRIPLRPTDWAALAAAGLLALTSTWIASSLNRAEAEAVRSLMAREGAQVQTDLGRAIDARLATLGRAASLLGPEPVPAAALDPLELTTWSDDLIAVAVVDATGRVLHGTSPRGPTALRYFDHLEGWPARRLGDSLRAARHRQEPSILATLEHRESGAVAVVLAAPAPALAGPGGFVLGVYDAHQLLEPMLANRRARGSLVEVFDVRSRLYGGFEAPARDEPWKWSWERVVELPGAAWRVRAEASEELVGRELTSAPRLVLTFGLLSAALAFLVLRRELRVLARTLREHARAADGGTRGGRFIRGVDAAVRRRRRSRAFDQRAFDRETLRLACERGLPPRLSASEQRLREPLR